MNNRLKELRKELKMSGEEFGKRIGMTKGGISMIERGVNKLSPTNIKLICQTFNVNQEWLEHGKGEMFTNNNDDELSRLVADIAMGYDDTAKAFLQAWIGLSDKDKKSVEKFIKEVAKGIK